MNPIDLNTAISFVYSNKLADILADKAKKHKLIVIIIIVLNALFMIPVIISMVDFYVEVEGSHSVLMIP